MPITTLAAIPSFAIPVAAAAIVIIFLAILAYSTYKVPRGNEALIITGLGTKGNNAAKNDDGAPDVTDTMSFKVVTGHGAFVLPVVQRSSVLHLDSRSVELGERDNGLICVSRQSVPVVVEAVMVFKIANDRASIANAATRFLEASNEVINQTIKDIAHGHLRTVVGGLSVEELIQDRTKLTDEVRQATAVEMQKLGLQIDSFQVKNIQDPQPNGYIFNLGKPEQEAVAAAARIAAAQRQQEASEREQESQAKVAEATRDSAVRQANAKSETDKAQAQAAQSGPLAAALARQDVVKADTAAAQLEAELEEQRLQTSVRKPADAQAYEQVTLANAQRDSAIAAAQANAESKTLAAQADKTAKTLEAEASANATQLDATAKSEATEKLGRADASAIEARALAEAKGIRERGLSEAAGIEARQQALSENADGVIAQEIAARLPEIVAAAAKQFDNVGTFTVLDGAEGLNKTLLSTIGVAGSVMPIAKELLTSTKALSKDLAAGAETPVAAPVKPAKARAPKVTATDDNNV